MVVCTIVSPTFTFRLDDVLVACRKLSKFVENCRRILRAVQNAELQFCDRSETFLQIQDVLTFFSHIISDFVLLTFILIRNVFMFIEVVKINPKQEQLSTFVNGSFLDGFVFAIMNNLLERD